MLPMCASRRYQASQPDASGENGSELTRLFDVLSDMVDSKAIGKWLKEPNPAFDGSTPLQVIERGETDRIWRMIWELQTGNTG